MVQLPCSLPFANDSLTKIGKVVVKKSGAVFLRIQQESGHVDLELESGIQPSFYQELVVEKQDSLNYVGSL